MNGIKIANITGGGLAGFTQPITGFAGNITGLLIENSVNSNSPIQLGQAAQGLNTLLTDINISGYNGNASTGGSFNAANTVIIANAAADLTKTINIGLKGVNLGTTNPATGGALQLTIANDSVVGGTAANPNKTYGTWAITTANKANLELTQDINGLPAAFGGTGGAGVGAATGLTLAGAGDIAVGASAAGDWRLLKTIDATKETGKVFITGNTAGNATNAFGTVAGPTANPNWLFGATAGLLANATPTNSLTSVLLGSGFTALDVSAMTAAQIKGLTTGAGAGVTLDATNEIIVKNSVATTLSTDTFANIKGFTQLGIGGNVLADGAAGTIDMKNLTPSGINKLIYMTAASGAVVINNVTTTLTVDTEDNGLGTNLTVGAVGPNAGVQDIFNLSIGNPQQKTVGTIGNVLMNGEEVVNIASVGGVAATFPASAAAGNSTGVFRLAPTIALQQVNITGDTDLFVGFPALNGAIFAENAAHTALLWRRRYDHTGDRQWYGSYRPVLRQKQRGRGWRCYSDPRSRREIINGADVAFPGYWGNGTGAFFSPLGFADGVGTSADMSTVANFKAGSAAALGDVVDFSVGAWGTSAFEQGLRTSNNVAVGANADATFTNDVAAGGTVVVNGSVVKMGGGPFLDASALANSLSSALGGITLGAAVAAGTDVHMLFAYQDLTGATRIADVDFFTVAATANTGLMTHVTASDMVQLTGVTLNTLNAHDIHFVT